MFGITCNSHRKSGQTSKVIKAIGNVGKTGFKKGKEGEKISKSGQAKQTKARDKRESETNNTFEKGNYNKVKDNYLKRKGIDAHELKKDFLGRKAPIAEYDIYVNKDTGELFIFKKGGKRIGFPTGEFIK